MDVDRYISDLEGELAAARAVLAKYPNARRAMLYEGSREVFVNPDPMPEAQHLCAYADEDDLLVIRAFAVVSVEGHPSVMVLSVALGDTPTYLSSVFRELQSQHPEAYDAVLRVAQFGRSP